MSSIKQELSVEPGLFKDIKFCIIDDVEFQEKVKQLLLDGGGKLINYLSDMVTHVIADNPDSPDVSEAQELFEKPVVTGRWVLLSARCNTLLPLSGFLPSKNQLFSGISAYSTQMSDNDTNAVWAMITFYGGKFHQTLLDTTTHLIAAKPEGEVYERALELYDQIKIVTPDWVVDSVKNKMIADEDLYHPRLLMLPEAQQSSVPEVATIPSISETLKQEQKQQPMNGIPMTSASVSLKMLLFPQQSPDDIALVQQQHQGGHDETTKVLASGAFAPAVQAQGVQRTPSSVAEGFVRTALSSLPPHQQQQLLQHLHQQQLQKQLQQQQQQSGMAQLTPLQQHQLQQQILNRQKQQQAQANLPQEVQGIILKPQEHTFPQSKPQQQQQHPLLRQFAPQNQAFQPSSAGQSQTFSPLQVPQQRMAQSQQQQQQVLIQQRLQWQMQQQSNSQQLTLAQQQQILQLKCQRQIQLQRAQSPGAGGQLVLQQKQQQQQAQALPRPGSAGGQPQSQQFQQQQGQPAVQRPPLQQQQQQLIQQQLLALQQMQQRQKLQQQQGQNYSAVLQGATAQSPSASPQQQVIMKPPPQYPFPERTPVTQLTGQPRIQFPNQAPSPTPPQGQRLLWQQQQGGQTQQSVLLQQSPRQLGPRLQQVAGTARPWAPPPQGGDQKDEQNQQLLKQQQHLIWQQRQLQQQQKQDQPRMQVTQQHPNWQQQQPPQQQPQQQQQQQQPQAIPQQQQQQVLPPREGGAPVTQQQILQWQQLKQLELQRRQQLLRQQQQQQLRYRMQLPSQSPNQVPTDGPPPPPPPPQYPGHSPGSVPPSQMTAVPAQYQPPIALTGQPQLSVAMQNAAIVNAKTKTALANLLNHRLQGTGRGPDNADSFTFPGRIQSMQAQPPVVLPENGVQMQNQLLSTPRKFEEAKAVSTPIKTLPTEGGAPMVAPVIKVHFFGHEPQIQVPGELCLLGCIFCVQDYNKHMEPQMLDTWKKVIEQHGGEVDEEYSAKCTHVLCENQRNSVVQQAMREGKRCITAYWLNDVLLQKKMQPPWLALHYPTPFSDDKPCKSQTITVTGFEGQERVWLKQMILSVGAKYTGYMTRQNTLVVCKTEDGVKYEKAREWRISTVNVQWVHDVMFGHYEAQKLPMVPKYQVFDMQDHFKVDYALVPHLMAVWKIPVKITDEMWKKYLPVLNARLENGKRKLDGEEVDAAAKQPRSSESPIPDENIPLTTTNPPSEAAKPRVVFTGVKQKSALVKIVYQLGGCLVTSVKDCTHLVTNKFQRTVKFLCALSLVKHVVTTEWLRQSAQQNVFLSEAPYALNDSEGEKPFGFSLQETLAKPDRKQLFKGYVIFVTPGVYPPASVLREIVECAGGVVVTKKKPTSRQIATMNQAGTKFLVITSENDLHLCKDFLNKKIGVHNAEFVLTGILKQELDFKAFSYNNNSS